mmetsp:Transcript_29889/g.86686  ORF Transcript_29889/g.86686 Transcript_29889/m.86686 type:complete len:85 (-) Transcript_29889:650-904(-)
MRLPAYLRGCAQTKPAQTSVRRCAYMIWCHDESVIQTVLLSPVRPSVLSVCLAVCLVSLFHSFSTHSADLAWADLAHTTHQKMT